ncbi:hypothetical protein ACYULU_08105 [Breznakiellaceae bacterium SP9]
MCTDIGVILKNMEAAIEFIDSAFRHGYDEESIRHASRTKIHDPLT